MTKDNAIELRRDVEARIGKARSIIEPALPKHVDFDSMVAKAYLEIASNSTLRKDPVSPVTVFWAFVHATSLGLDIGRASEEAYIIPYRQRNETVKRAQLVISYKGLVKLAYQHPRILSINAHTVFENDQFDIDLGSEPKVVFKPNLLAPRGKVIAAFAIVEITPMQAGGPPGKLIEVMSRDDIDKVKSSAMGSGDAASPWNAWYEEMACKTVLRRVLKRAPRSSEVQLAMKIENSIESGDPMIGEFQTETDPGRVLKGQKLRDRIQKQLPQSHDENGEVQEERSAIQDEQLD